jgi:drug/metabolite transporter (DMT)-like permease
LFFVLGLSRTSVAHAGIIVAIGPILVLLLAALRGQEHLTARKLLGLAVALTGVTLLQTLEARPRGPHGPAWTGDLLVFLGTLTFALFTVFGKSATARHSSVTVNTVAYVGAAIAMLPVTLWQSAGFNFARVSTLAWSCAFYMALFPSVICYLIYYHALTHMAPSRVSAFSYLQPPLVAVMGVFLLDEHITAALAISALVILAGIYLTERC